jgi:PhnB protein
VAIMASDMALKPHLSIMFDGQCEAAFRFYERCLNGTISFMLTWGHSPAAAEAPPDWAEKVYHATLEVGDFVMTGGDLPSDKYEKPKGFSIVLGVDNPAVAQRIFDELAENGRIAMPLQETFWASRYGALVDQFGIAWEVNCERPAEPGLSGSGP